jgi:hypothetical protein
LLIGLYFTGFSGLEIKGLDVNLVIGGESMSLARIPIPHCRATIDGKAVITVSYNWSSTAESRNDENAIIVVDLGKLSPTEATISYTRVFAKIFMVMRAPT